MNYLKILLFLLILVAGNACSEKHSASSVKEIMDKTITRLYATMDEKALASITNEQSMSFFTKDELQVLATRYWYFDVNVPVIVSVMRSTEQKNVPFWLVASGFKKTGMTMKNEMVTYEVWQKKFGAGTVGLGINGFENYRLHYFVSVAPANKNDRLELSHFFPANQYAGILDDGAFTYHDWDELVLMNVPESMKGQKLLTTIRGRGSESGLVGAFRETAFPSSDKPDQVLLTWSFDPETSMDIQWRTDTTVKTGVLCYRQQGTSDVVQVQAEKLLMEDRELMNDRFIYRYTAKLRDLKPATTYKYLITPATDWSQACSFTTSGPGNSFSFVWFGDTHHSPKFGEIIYQAEAAHSDAAFYSIAGDLVSDGLYRDQWDDLWAFSKNVICRKPLMAVPGNHDNRYGLGSKMYRDMFSYPLNGPDGVEKEQTYSFTCKNALFLMIDATSPVDAQTEWIEKQLAGSDAEWKIAMFHFPPYNWEEPYTGIQQAWVPLFDKYHVDMVLSGHIHYYMRSKPMKAGKVVGSYNEGTAYIISLGIPGTVKNITDEPYAAVRQQECWLYQYVKIDGDKLLYRSVNHEGKVIDSFEIDK